MRTVESMQQRLVGPRAWCRKHWPWLVIGVPTVVLFAVGPLIAPILNDGTKTYEDAICTSVSGTPSSSAETGFLVLGGVAVVWLMAGLTSQLVLILRQRSAEKGARMIAAVSVGLSYVPWMWAAWGLANEFAAGSLYQDSEARFWLALIVALELGAWATVASIGLAVAGWQRAVSQPISRVRLNINLMWAQAGLSVIWVVFVQNFVLFTDSCSY